MAFGEAPSVLENRNDCLELLRCPRTGLPLRQADASTLVTATADPDRQHRYAIVSGLPVLIDFQRSVIDELATLARAVASPVRRAGNRGLVALAKRLVSPTNSRTVRNVAHFVALLKASTSRPMVLAIGGATVGQGMEALYADPRIRLMAFDIYGSQLRRGHEHARLSLEHGRQPAGGGLRRADDDEIRQLHGGVGNRGDPA